SHLGDDPHGQLVRAVGFVRLRRDDFVGELLDRVVEFAFFVAEVPAHDCSSLGASWGSIVATTWSSLTRPPAVTVTVTTPATGAGRRCSIFMASIVAIVSPTATSSPVAAATDTTVPGMGERTSGLAGRSSRSMRARASLS